MCVLMSSYFFRADGVHNYDDLIVGVMGMDFTMPYFYNLVTKYFDECTDITNYAGLVLK